MYSLFCANSFDADGDNSRSGEFENLCHERSRAEMIRGAFEGNFNPRMDKCLWLLGRVSRSDG